MNLLNNFNSMLTPGLLNVFYLLSAWEKKIKWQVFYSAFKE